MNYKWEIIRDFQGKSHKDGGIDISITGGRIVIKKNNSQIKAADGLFLQGEDPPSVVNKVGQVDITAKTPKGYLRRDAAGNIILTPDELRRDFEFTQESPGFYNLNPKKKKFIEDAFNEKLPKSYSVKFMDLSELSPESYSKVAKDFEFNNKYDEFLFPSRDNITSKYVKSNEDWKQAYENLNKDITSINNYKKFVPTEYILKRQNNGISYVGTNKKETIDPITDKIIEYKNSEQFIERLAGSYYNKDIDIDKWISEPWYREHFAKRYLNENGDNVKKIINEFSSINPKMEYSSEGFGMTYNDKGLGDTRGIISANNVLHGGNYKTKEEWTNSLKNFLENKGVSPYLMDSVIESIQKEFENTKSSGVVSHEQYHNQFNKKNLLDINDKDFKEKYDKLFAENNLIWDLNKFTKNIPVDDYKETLGYARYDDSKPSKNLTHQMSPEETKADIYSTRDFLRYKYDYEHINQPFNDEMFNKLMNDEEWKKSLIGKRMLERFGDDKKTWKIIMNLIAAGDVNTKNVSKIA